MSNSLLNAFDSFVVERREEILSVNTEYIELGNKILEVEKELKSILNEKELKLFNEFERLSVEQQTLGEYLCLKNSCKNSF